MMDLRNVRTAPAFVLGIVVGGLVAGIAVTSLSSSSGDPRPVRKEQSAATVAVRRATADCHEVFDRQTSALRAAHDSLAQWKVHVGAMNKLVAGTITLDQAQAFWNQTRVGAKRLLARYRTDALAFGRADAVCTGRAPGGARSEPLRQCRQAISARGEALRAADTAIETWRHHVHDMEMLRMGRMSPATATKMWLRSWRTGVKQLDAYHAAAREARQQTC